MRERESMALAERLLRHCFARAEGRTDQKLDLEPLLDAVKETHSSAQIDGALEWLVNKGFLNSFGENVAFLTEAGARAGRTGQLTPPTADIPKGGTPNGRLTLIDREGNRRTFNLGDVVSIGRHENNSIRLLDQRASKRHAVIERQGPHFVLRDLGAANGTILNGHYVEEAVLSHGDQLLIGRSELIFEAPLVPASTGEQTAVPSDLSETAEMAPVDGPELDVHVETPTVDPKLSATTANDPLAQALLAAPTLPLADEHWPENLARPAATGPETPSEESPFLQIVSLLRQAAADDPQLVSALETVATHPRVQQVLADIEAEL